MFLELGGNPFILPPQPKKEHSIQSNAPSQLTPGQRATRSHTNSLPRTKKPRYAEDYFDNSSNFEDEDHYRSFGEISECSRVLALFYICQYKLDTDDELKHELKYVPMDSVKIRPIGYDSENNGYYYFDNLDSRIYKESVDKSFKLEAKNAEQVKELIQKLLNNGSSSLAGLLQDMVEKLQQNEQELKRKMVANIRRECAAPIKQRSLYDEMDDSDFSPVDDFLPRKRGPGRPRKIPLPERKPKIMPETSGDQLLMEGQIFLTEGNQEKLYSFTGTWSVKGKYSQEFKYLKAQGSDVNGLYNGYWNFNSQVIEETIQVTQNGGVVIGSGENMFGLFLITGIYNQNNMQEESLTEQCLGTFQLKRQYVRLQIDDESSCSEGDSEIYDPVKPYYKLEFEERVGIEHMRIPNKSMPDLKRQLKQQMKRELRRVPFNKSEYFTN